MRSAARLRPPLLLCVMKAAGWAEPTLSSDRRLRRRSTPDVHHAARHHRLLVRLLPEDEAAAPPLLRLLLLLLLLLLLSGLSGQKTGEPAHCGRPLPALGGHSESEEVQGLGSVRGLCVRVRDRRPAAGHGSRRHGHRPHPGGPPRGRAVPARGRGGAAGPLGVRVSQQARADGNHREVPRLVLHHQPPREPAGQHPVPPGPLPQQEDHQPADGQRPPELQPPRGAQQGGHPHAAGDLPGPGRGRGEPAGVAAEAAQPEPVRPPAARRGLAGQPGLPVGAGLHHGGAAPPGVQPQGVGGRAAARVHAAGAGLRGGRPLLLRGRTQAGGDPLPRRPVLLPAHPDGPLPGAAGRRGERGAGEGVPRRAGAHHADRALPHPQAGLVRLRRALRLAGRHRGDQEGLRDEPREAAAAAAAAALQPRRPAQVGGGVTVGTAMRSTHWNVIEFHNNDLQCNKSNAALSLGPN